MSYRSEEISVVWMWTIGFTILVFFLGWTGLAIYTDQKRSLNPEIVRLENERRKQEAEQTAKDRQQYIEGCKAAGKAPSDMSDSKSYWECE